MGIFVFGLNHKECPVEIREKIHFTKAQIEIAYKVIRERPEIAELVILSTCNRVEMYGFSGGVSVPEQVLFDLLETTHGLKREELMPYMVTCHEKDAIRHIFRVAAGLDSLVVGENEILGQMRDAFRLAAEQGSAKAIVYRLMEKALKAGKEVRSKTRINKGAVSIPSVGVELAGKIFGKMSSEKVMVLGTGEMSLLTLRNLNDSGANVLYIVSRDRERGSSLAAEFGAEWLSYEDWPKHLENVDILIASTAAPHPLVGYKQVKAIMEKRKHRPLFLIDIAVPRNIEGEVHNIDDVYLYNIDDLKGVSSSNLRRRKTEMDEAEVMVERCVESFSSWQEQLKARPTLERLEGYLNGVIEGELDLLVREGELSESRKAEIQKRIRNKILYAPISVIKDASRNGGVKRYVEALQSLFHLDKKDS